MSYTTCFLLCDVFWERVFYSVMFFRQQRVFYSVMFFENVFSTLWWLFDELVKKDKNTLSRLLRNTCHTHITRITHITLFFINGLSRRGFIRGLCFFCVICVICVMFFSPPKNHIMTNTFHTCPTHTWYIYTPNIDVMDVSGVRGIFISL